MPINDQVTAPVSQQPQTLGMKVTKFVSFLVHSHWLWVFTIIGVQYTSGQVLGRRWESIASLLSFKTWRQIHLLNSNIIFASVVVMLLVKVFLWLRRRGKI